MYNERGISITSLLSRDSSLVKTASITLPFDKRSIDYSSRNTLNSEGGNHEDDVKILRRKFLWFSLVASANHSLYYVVACYATSLLDPTLAGAVLGLQLILNAVSGLTVATPACLYLGFKYAMIISLWGYAFEIGTFFLAITIPAIGVQWFVGILGSIVAGFTSAIWWTSQGIYFEHICKEISQRLALISKGNKDTKQYEGAAEEISLIDQVRADLSADWTVIYQGVDIVVFLSISLFTISGQISTISVIGGLTVLGVLTACLGYTFDSIEREDQEPVSMAEVKEAIVSVPRQYRDDARVTLLAPFVFGFAISTALFAYYINDKVITEYLGIEMIGYLEAFSYLVAILAAYPYAFVFNNLSYGQDLVIQFGSLCFLLTGMIVVALQPEQMGTYGVMFAMKGLYGLGRGVFEGTCRAVYASLFTGKDLSAAFSGQTLAVGFSGGICFFIFGYLSRPEIGSISITNGVVAICTYGIIMTLSDRNSKLPWSLLCHHNNHCYNYSGRKKNDSPASSTDFYYLLEDPPDNTGASSKELTKNFQIMK